MTSEQAGRVLLVDDDKASLESITLFLERKGYEVIAARNGREAVEHLTDGVHVIVTDFAMPEMNGLELLRTARENVPHTAVIMVTGQGSEDVAVQAIQAGAYHYLTKPIDPHELLNLVRQASEKYLMSTEIAELHQQLQAKYGFAKIIGTSPEMRKVFETIRMVADTRSTVLIEGASGTGKELVAHALHYNGNRRNKPFMAINCAALPATLVESELFGHERGAFTGAVDRRVGKFQAADGGTLLIDEIGDMPLDLQSKLLRAIESRSVTPIGSNREIKLDVRIVAATNQDLLELTKHGDFREDLYYRLSVVNIKLPSLKDRSGDIPLLVRAFIDELARECQRSVRDITPAALTQLQNYAWPGNVRQLRNVLEGIIVTASRETIDLPDLPETIRAAQATSPAIPRVTPGITLEELEKEAIRQTLSQNDGNRTWTATQLGISLRTLQRKIKEYGL